MYRRVVVATDGSSTGWGAVRFAAALARRTGAAVYAVAVLEPLVSTGGRLQAQLPHAGELDRARADELRGRVMRQLQGAPGAAAWPLEIRRGWAGGAIAHYAREVGADLIVMGRPSRSSRISSGIPMAAEVLGLSATPVLAAVPDLSGLPTSAVAAVDFGTAGVESVRYALGVLGSPARLRLVHAAPRFDFPAALLWGWNESYSREAPAELERLAADLGAGPNVELTTEVAQGDPAGVLLSRASGGAADLLVLGGQGYLYRGRVLIGGIAPTLLRAAPCSVLLVPPGDALAHPELGSGAGAAAFAQQA